MTSMSSEKINKAAAVRKYQAENPNAKPKDVAAAVGCDVTYVYLVNSKERSKTSQKKPKVTRGQEILRKELTQHDLLIADKNKIIVGLHEEVARLNVIIQWLEGRLRGTSV
jgi:hypothetical protein